MDENSWLEETYSLQDQNLIKDLTYIANYTLISQLPIL